jgi:putative ABC transport system permease protein
MLRNYINIAFRQISKNANSFPLSISLGWPWGLTFCFLTFIWYRFEHSYDRHYPTVDRLYRLNYELNFTGSAFTIPRSPAPFAPMLPNHFPEIEQTTRFYPRSISVKIPGKDREFEVENAFFADSTTMQVFGFETMHGDPDHALHTPFSIVLTDKTALRFFGTEECMGKQLMLANHGPFTVGGVVRAMPENAHFTFDFLAPFRNIPDVEPDFARAGILEVIQNNKLASYANTYVLLKKGAKAASVNARFKDFVLKNGMKEMRDKQNFSLFPVQDIHLKSTVQGEVVPTANPEFLQLFALIGLLILAIAVVNFVNLSTAAQLSRAKEVGVHKVLGSQSWQIIRQLLTETFLLGLPAFLLALLLTQAIFGANGNFFRPTSPTSLLDKMRKCSCLFFGVFAMACLLAGIYPAFFASRFKATDIFRGTATGQGQRQAIGSPKASLRLQFTVAVALLVGAGIVLRQIDYLKNRPLGLQSRHDAWRCRCSAKT